MADALDSKSSGETRVGSNPTLAIDLPVPQISAVDSGRQRPPVQGCLASRSFPDSARPLPNVDRRNVEHSGDLGDGVGTAGEEANDLEAFRGGERREDTGAPFGLEWVAQQVSFTAV